ncbi:MAG: helix-turn-helix transcriptional regulator [Candidatus Omnitrophica bacterium]|nr:helix-turn-helix transcriptional regulator [Candidatus Omnitrophota bacterium]HOD12296.1 helix-turn-helix transcriptional regulator [Candidatus Omnitrophota bacterium]
MDLIKELDSYRLENKITQQVLAEQLGVSFVTVNRWFNNKTMPNKIQQYHIEKFLKNKTCKKI